MTVTQRGYEWLNRESGPADLLAAISLFGTHEVLGPRNNPVIMGWAEEVHTTYPGDATAWCGLLQSVIKKRAGWDYHPNGNALWALNWADWGVKREGPALLGDTLVKRRKGGGHVTQYVGEDNLYYHCLGGNQSDSVDIVRILKTDFIAVRHAPWRTAQPANVRRIYLSVSGAPVSVSEA